MKYIDQHMHTKFSFDSSEEFENYLALTDNQIITTEHLDLGDPGNNFEDRPLDLDLYNETVDRLNLKHHNRILKGIEVGWSQSQHDRILAILSSYHFDLVLLSIHNNGRYDYMDRKADYISDPAILVPQYLENLYLGLEAMAEHVQVLAHFDYGFRIVPISKAELKTYGETHLKKLFKLLIEKDVSFEINTGSIVRFDNWPLYEYAIPLYLELGGNNFTLGSDAHFINSYQKEFDTVIAYLDKHGVEYLTYYIDQKPQKVLIKELLNT